ncbi:hypothetical protein OAI23_03450 [Alphaproteobacteria bacterium]|nr:hypothetical protein [Alphaproteobacteria bacterium]
MFSDSITLRKCDERAEQSVVDEFIQKLKNDTFSVSGADRQFEWEEGWSETGFKPDPFNQHINIPFYFGKNEFIRVDGALYTTSDKFAELKFLRALHLAGYRLLDKIFTKQFALAEFGCGTGHNIALAPNKYQKYAYDWVWASKQHLSSFPEIKFDICDFFNESTFKAPLKNYVIFTNDALEQTGVNFRKFLDYHVHNKYCLGGIHFEPIPGHFDGVLATQSDIYHFARGYLIGLTEYFKLCQATKQITTLYSVPSGLGSKFLNSHHITLWVK